MSEQAHAFAREGAYLERGHILEKKGAAWVVALGAQSATAERAASCLVEPSVGDAVLVATCDGGSAFLLAVLTRAEPAQPLCIEAESGVEVRARGAFAVTAEGGIDLSTPARARIAADELALKAREGNVLIRALSLFGESLDARLGRGSVVARTLDATAERLRQQLDRCYRFVSGLDQLRAGTIDYDAKGFARVHAEDAIVTADALVKIDGKQIHVG